MEKPLFWHQGLFLQPQHLQLNDLHSQSKFTPYHKYLQSYLYGAGNIEIKEDALSNYSLQIDKGEFWFKDMTYTVVNDNAIIEPRAFNDVWDEKTDSLIVYVGLKRHSNNSENVSSIKSGESLAELQTRYSRHHQVSTHDIQPPASIRESITSKCIIWGTYSSSPL